MNGLIMGVKGFLSFLSAPLIGALSDVWGRKFFLLITVLFTCSPIPFMAINAYWYFAMIAVSGLFAVTFSVAFAYVSDVTTESERSASFGLVSATFAASLITSPALGAYLSHLFGDTFVVFVATLIALVDVAYIMFLVPESLPEKLRLPSSVSPFSWESVDPFMSLKKAGKDPLIMKLCVAVFLSYLPEAGQFSCFFVYLRLVIGFTPEDVALFIAVVGLMSVIAQTIVMASFMRMFNSKNTIMIGLGLQAIQSLCYGFGSSPSMMWFAGILASFASITYPAISSYVSTYSNADQQGLVQGMITGIRGLCNGLGPAMFGLIFNLFHVDLNKEVIQSQHPVAGVITSALNRTASSSLVTVPAHVLKSNSTIPFIPGPPFVFGSLMVLLAMFVVIAIPQITQYKSSKTSTISSDYYYTHVDLSLPRDDGSWNKSSGTLLSKKNDDHETSSNLETMESSKGTRIRTNSQLHKRSGSHDLDSISEDGSTVSVTGSEVGSNRGMIKKNEPMIVRVKRTGGKSDGKNSSNSACELDIPLLDNDDLLEAL